ncbi:30S ribosomal protein S2 [bacterium]|nr:30S ribosomal protein S2 [bacterium]
MDNQEPVSASSIQNVNTESTVIAVDKKITGSEQLPRVTVDQLLLAGAHFGHLTRRWNPKMKKYIFSSRNGIYLIDLFKTQKLINVACDKIAKIAASGEDIMFVGTKKQARDIIESEAKRAGASYVTYRWLGGMLTNFSTIRKSLKTMENYERMATDGTYEKLRKKEILTIEKAKEKLLRVLGGIRDMRRLPGAIFIVDTNHESISVAEARKLDIPVFAIVDTNVDPDLVDYPIPANDDAFKSIGLISRAFADAIIEGKKHYQDAHVVVEKEAPVQAESEKPHKPKRRRSRRRKPSGDRPGGERQSSENKESK